MTRVERPHSQKTRRRTAWIVLVAVAIGGLLLPSLSDRARHAATSTISPFAVPTGVPLPPRVSSLYSAEFDVVAIDERHLEMGVASEKPPSLYSFTLASVDDSALSIRLQPHNVVPLATPLRRNYFRKTAFVLTLPRLPPGFYRVALSVRDQKPTLGQDNSFYVPSRPFRLPPLYAGERFRVLNSAFAPSTVLPDDVLRVTSTAAAGSGLWGVDERTGAHVRLPARRTEIGTLSGLTALVDDKGVEAARAILAGRRMWPLGYVPVTCVAGPKILLSGSLAPWATIRVLDVARLSNTVQQTNLGLLGNRQSDLRASAYWAINPLFIRFDLSTPPEIRLDAPVIQPRVTQRPSSVNPARTYEEAWNNIAHYGSGACFNLTTMLSDAWEAGRTLASGSPLGQANLPQQFRDAIIAGRVKIGMTPAMVAAAVGYPSRYGTAAKMLSLSTWEYENGVPWSFSVYFRRGRVVESTQDQATLP
jgi:hypothetical protein